MKINLANIKKAKNLLNKRECVAVPTETVYGIAGNAYSDTACKNIFRLKKIPFRSFYIKQRNEKTLGELFCFFTLEVILLSHLLKVNPLDQPEVELVKKETFKILGN